MIILILTQIFGFRVSASRLLCDDFSSNVEITPPIIENTGKLVNWSLLSPDILCTDPARRPQFEQVQLDGVSLISVCYECPQCTIVLPESFELPIGSTVKAIFVVGRRMPYNRPRTDIPIHYVLTQRNLPSTLKNCEVIIRAENRLGEQTFSWPNLALCVVVFLTVVFCVCCIRCTCSRLTNNGANQDVAV